jgi:N-acetylneuraminic acid mutarotase
MVEARDNHTATLLADGRVLVAGGLSGPKVSVASAEVYDPANGSWTATGSLATGRYWHTATLLPDGKVLIAGGAAQTGGGGEPTLASAELFDPVTGTWSVTGTMADARFAHTATPLGDGRVLVVGGTGLTSAALASAELYDPALGLWAPTASMSSERVSHFAMLLPGGQILVGGGGDVDSVPLPTAELYDPGSGS